MADYFAVKGISGLRGCFVCCIYLLILREAFSAVCEDDPTFDCAHISSVFDICSDVAHAKAVCAKFCRFCSPATATTPPTTTSSNFKTPSISIIPAGPNISVMYTRPVEVSCLSDPGVSTVWTYRGSSTLPKGVTIDSSGKLKIHALNETNAGVYKCIAITKNGGVNVASLIIGIKETPAIVVQIIKAPVDHLLAENEQLTLECLVIGWPIPTINWSFTGLRGNTNIPQNVEFSNNGRVITISHYNSFNDDGKWTCFAKNHVGQSKGYTIVP